MTYDSKRSIKMRLESTQGAYEAVTKRLQDRSDSTKGLIDRIERMDAVIFYLAERAGIADAYRAERREGDERSGILWVKLEGDIARVKKIGEDSAAIERLAGKK